MTHITNITDITYVHSSYYLHNSYYLLNSHFKVYFFEAYKKIFFIIFFLYIKMVNKYYQKDKERLRIEARERYQNLSEEEKVEKGKKSSRKISKFY